MAVTVPPVVLSMHIVLRACILIIFISKRCIQANMTILRPISAIDVLSGVLLSLNKISTFDDKGISTLYVQSIPNQLCNHKHHQSHSTTPNNTCPCPQRQWRVRRPHTDQFNTIAFSSALAPPNMLASVGTSIFLGNVGEAQHHLNPMSLNNYCLLPRRTHPPPVPPTYQLDLSSSFSFISRNNILTGILLSGS